MLESLTLAAALVGTLVAAAYDLKTTEIPDFLPYAMIGLGIATAALGSYLSGDPEVFLRAMLSGVILSAVGAALYFTGQWGDGDAYLLASVGFLVRGKDVGPLPFPLAYFFDVVFVGALYIVVYSTVVALQKKERVGKALVKKARRKKFFYLRLFAVSFAASFFSVLLLLGDASLSLQLSFLVSATFALVYLLLDFLKSVEEAAFRKRVRVEDLRVGDVLETSRVWKGIDEDELKRLRSSGRKFVRIKTGVRFAPVFFITLLLLCLGYSPSVVFFQKILILPTNLGL